MSTLYLLLLLFFLAYFECFFLFFLNYLIIYSKSTISLLVALRMALYALKDNLSALYSYSLAIAVPNAVIYQFFGVTHTIPITLKGDFIGLGLLKVKSSDPLGLFYPCSAVLDFLPFALLLFSVLGSDGFLAPATS